MDHRIGLFVAQQGQQAMVMLAHRKVLDPDGVVGQFVPGADAFAQGADRGQAADFQFHVDLAARQVVHDHHVMAARRKMQRRRPAAETVSAQNDDLHEPAFIGPRFGAF